MVLAARMETSPSNRATFVTLSGAGCGVIKQGRIMKSMYRKKLALIAGAAALIFSAVMAHATAVVTPDITYTWKGDCLDCNHPLDTATPASATIVLRNYTPGTALTSLSQVVSFRYSSLLFDLGTSAPTYVSGNIPTAGGVANFDIRWVGGPQANESYDFHTYTTGRWIFWEDAIPNDFGTNGNVQLDAQAPAPATIALLGLSLAGLGFSRRKQA
jgi:hypothetical protein